MKNDSMEYENPWRPNYEVRATALWFMSAVVAFGVNQLTDLPNEPFYWMFGIAVFMAALKMPRAISVANLQRHLKGRPLEFIKVSDVKKLIAKKKGTMWLGHGFIWENRHAQRVFEILKRDWSQVVDHNEKKLEEESIGQAWIHGVEPKEKELYQLLEHSEGQNLILGTTGAGKTRLFDLLITQAVLRGECCIIIDPKGDKELCENARRATIADNHPERFVYFHPAHPEKSTRFDSLRNYTRVTEIASRLAALIQSEETDNPFTNFSWQAVNNVAQAMVMTLKRPSIVALKRYLESGPQEMVVQAVKMYAERNIVNGKDLVDRYINDTSAGSIDKQARAMLNFYETIIQQEAPSPELEGLLSMFRHDRSHFSKMVSSLLPIMNMLTAGEVGKLLSPNYNDFDDKRPITDSKKIVDNAQVFYMGLDSLTDGTVAGAVGSLALADIVAVAGDRYNFGDRLKTVNIFVDEGSEVINDATIRLLNKGRGAKIKMFVATQTIADFTVRLGSKDKAYQVLGNINNLIALRVLDKETQEYITDNLPKTRIKLVMRTQGMNSNSDAPLMFSSNTGERLMEEEGDLFPPQLLGMLKNLEYIAKISGGMIVKGRLPILTE